MIKPNSTILFIGDSVTDVGRINEIDPTVALGTGYPKKVFEYIETFCKDKNIKVLNRGISGHRVVDLQSRWEKDCIDLKPDYVSILIGINDTWRRYDSNDITSCEAFEKGYREILTKLRDKLDCEIVLLEPFIIMSDPAKEQWYEDLMPKIGAIRRLANEFKAFYIPLDGIFAAHSTFAPPSHWSEDGVHPSDAGHALIAMHWLDTML